MTVKTNFLPPTPKPDQFWRITRVFEFFDLELREPFTIFGFRLGSNIVRKRLIGTAVQLNDYDIKYAADKILEEMSAETIADAYVGDY